MRTLQAEVLVVGGGITGVGVLRDLALRGIKAVLIEQYDLAHGASSRFHGLLHSGARYAVRDGAAARECITENFILRRIAPHCVEETGGYFLAFAGDDETYIQHWLAACREAGIPVREEDPGFLKKRYPFLNQSLTHAYLVPDGTVDGFRLAWANVYQARLYGAEFFTYTRLERILVTSGRITGAEAVNTLTGEKLRIECSYIVNAAGAWAGKVAALAGLDVPLLLSKGTLIAFNHRLTDRVLNHLRPPADGDIWVPHHTITILGTTSVNVEDPERARPTKAEIEALLTIGREMIPGLDSYRILRAFAGVRPLYAGDKGVRGDGRSVSRDFKIIDHGLQDGLEGFITLAGGKFTTYRLMAEKTVDYLGGLMGIIRPCRTAEVSLLEGLPAELAETKGTADGATATATVPAADYTPRLAVYRYGLRAPAMIKRWTEEKDRLLICECEKITAGEIAEVAGWDDTHNLDDVRRKTRLGMGTCQGVICALRALNCSYESLKMKEEKPVRQLKNFLNRRFSGQKYLLWGEQAREAEFALGVYGAVLGLNEVDDDV